MAGVRFGRAIDLNVHAASISLFTHKYPGYSRLSFMVGISDNATPGETGKLVVTADGKVVDVVVKAYGQAARRVTVSFDKASMITLAADPDGVQGVEDIIIGDPVLQR